ncbi:zinc finger protein 804A [Dendrobates tinctorius]|uniref:zinc finger protein 804A n=1 Tax=Dendrobates tinctorius TaxID=92724 RepID=UPI003CC97976
MECYYIVISSSHLSNGHFRNVKGVFRRPLTSSTTLDLSEKENSRGNALESLKANFYCELCDKQYYKHQEFDNHINSYDHAHKQRLKELKQREFSRNVASKLRRNERKQKKYLQRLHKLAEHKRESSCAPGSGPMFKSTTVTVHDHIHGSLQGTIVHTAEREKPQLASITNIHNSTNMASILLPSSESTENGTKTQKDREHKISFSFSFPKKTPVKLEASAAVFYEFNEEISTGLKKRSRFLPGSFSVQSSLPLDTVSCLNDEAGESMSSSEKPSSRRGDVFQDIDQKQLPEKELTSFLTSDVCHIKVPLEFEVQAQRMNSDTLIPSKHNVSDHNTDHDEPDIECLKLQLPCPETVSNILNDQVVLKNGETKTSNNTNECATDIVSNVSANEDENKIQKNEKPNKRLNDAFHPVQSRDGSKVLQWPSEMIQYTCTQPALSYSCNPLHFDFRSSKAINQKDQPVCHNSTFIDNDPNTMLKLNCETVISEGNNDPIKSCHHISKASAKLKCYSLICSIKEDQKHNISKYLMDNDFDFGKKKSKRKYYRTRRRGRKRKCKVNESRMRYRQQCHVNDDTQNCFKNLKQHDGSKDSICSLKNLTFSHQLPHAESNLTERELLKRPTLKIKEECEVWNVDQKKGITNQIENELSKNTRSFNYQSKVLQLDHCSQNIAYSKTFCSWSSNKIFSNHENHETFINHSYTFKRTRRTIIDEIQLSFKKPRLCRTDSSSQQAFFPKRNFSILYKPIHIRSAEGIIKRTGNTSRNRYYKLIKHKWTFQESDKFLNENYYKLAKESLRAKEFLKKIVKIKKVVENKLDQLCKNLLAFKHNKPALCSSYKAVSTGAEKSTRPSVKDSELNGDFVTFSKDLQHFQEQSSTWPIQACNGVRNNASDDKPENEESQGLAMDEELVTTKKCITEQLLSHVTIPYQQTLHPETYSKKLKYHQCARYGPTLQPFPFPTRFKLIFPAGAIQTCATVHPLPLEPPLCTSSLAALPQHLIAPFPTASVDSIKLISPQQQFLCPQSQSISRTPYYQMTMEPSLCTRDAFGSSPQVPIITNTVLCHFPVPLPQPSHTTVFTPVHSHLPTLIPLHSLF